MIKPQLTPKVKEKCKSWDRQANAVVVVSVEEAEVLSMCVANLNLRNNIFFLKANNVAEIYMRTTCSELPKYQTKMSCVIMKTNVLAKT